MTIDMQKKSIKIFADDPQETFCYYNDVWQNDEFQITYDHDIRECDVLVVFAEGDWNPIRFNTTAARRICFTGEPQAIYEYSSAFFNQFTDVVTSQVHVQTTAKMHIMHQCNNLFIGRNMRTREFDKQRAKDTFENIVKDKLISVIASNKAQTEYHRKRQEFIHRLKNDIPELDVFGAVVGRPFDFKDDALRRYKFSIAIENCKVDDYWTEKLGDCIYARTEPIYCGCPNISKYFDGITSIDINDYDSSLQIVRKEIADTPNMSKLTQRREEYLKRWSLHNVIFKILNTAV